MCLSFFITLLCVLSSFAIILKRAKKLAVLLSLSYICPDTVIILFVTVNVQSKSEYDQEIPLSHTADQPTAP